MKGKQAIAASALTLMLAMGPGAAWSASGTALGVKPQAQADKDGSSRVLTVGADVFIGDLIKTGAAGNVQIKFDDKTELVVGPNSELLIEDYLLRDDQSAGKFAINALAGTFRFATGNASKDRYLIRTPTGTIGVRGTTFDFNVFDETEVLLYHGVVLLCNTANQCVTLDGTCEIGSFDTSQSQIIGPADEVSGQLRDDLKGRFEFAQNQGPLDRQFWVEQARDCFNKGFVGNNTTESLMQGKDDSGCDDDEVEYAGVCYPDYPDYGY